MANTTRRYVDSASCAGDLHSVKSWRASANLDGSSRGLGKFTGLGVKMQNSMVYAAIVTAMGVAGLGMGVGVEKTTSAITSPPPSVSMSLKKLVYEHGEFGQSFEVSGGAIKAEWAAEVIRGNRQLCLGGGQAPYEGKSEIKYFTPDQWTGSECPELQTGDIGRAVWTYRTIDGLFVTISGEIVIEEES